MPAEGLQWLPKSDILSYEEIADVVRQLAPLGLRRLRITGGEPTIRPDLERLVRMLREVPEIEDFARLTLERPWHVRFIELMPVGEMRELTWEHVVPSDEVLQRITRLGALAPDDGPARGNGPARYHRLAGAAGTVGVITPMTHTYCGSCNRVRLTADGRLRTCLYGDHEVNLRDPLRRGEALEPLFRQALAEKPKEHALLQMKVGGLRALSQVGG
jgi:cyclic pyranopterin phosphate synthase